MAFNPALLAIGFGLLALPVGFALGWSLRLRSACALIAVSGVAVVAALWLRSMAPDKGLLPGDSITDDLSNAFWAIAATWIGATVIGYAIGWFLTPDRRAAAITPLRAADDRRDDESDGTRDRTAA